MKVVSDIKLNFKSIFSVWKLLDISGSPFPNFADVSNGFK